MTRKTKINLLISTGIVLILFSSGYLIMMKDDPIGFGYLLFSIYVGAFSLSVGIISFILDMQTGKFWNNIFFITSCLMNLGLSYFPILWLMSWITGLSGMKISFFTISLFPTLVCFAQIIRFIKGNKRERQLIKKNANVIIKANVENSSHSDNNATN